MSKSGSAETRDIIVVGASTGGIEALKVLVADLPTDLDASVFVVLHTAAHAVGVLPQILEKAGPLRASNATNWQPIERGHIYVAPPDHHLLLERAGYARVTRGPKENRFRPAVDPLFRSAAHAFGPRVIGVILTGWLDDGTAGLWAVKQRGGVAIVQTPEEALAPDMPLNAIKHVEVDHCVALKDIAPLLVRLTRMPADEKELPMIPKEMETELRVAREENALEVGIMEWGEPSSYACPECHGVLAQLKEGSNLRFRCHTGHAYSIDSLLAEFTEKTEETLWSGIRALEEGVILLNGMAAHLREHDQRSASETLLAKAKEAQERAELVRKAVMRHEKLSTGKLVEPAAVG